MALILDTNALSAFADGDTAIESIVRRAQEIAIPAVVLGEYRFGIAQSRQKKSYEKWLEQSLGEFRVLAVDEQTSRKYASLRLELKKMGKPIPSNDLWIAALTRQHALRLLSRDRHFDDVPGLMRIEW